WPGISATHPSSMQQRQAPTTSAATSTPARSKSRRPEDLTSLSRLSFGDLKGGSRESRAYVFDGCLRGAGEIPCCEVHIEVVVAIYCCTGWVLLGVQFAGDWVCLRWQDTC